MPRANPASTIKSIETECNEMSKVWLKMFNVGAGSGQEGRISGSVINSFTRPAPLYGLRKDHKRVQVGQDPPTRPVCGAVSGPNATISKLISEFIGHLNTAVGDEKQSHSTEDVLSRIDKFNRSRTSGNLEIVSLDVVALYPSLNIGLCKEVVYQLVTETDVTFENVSYKVAKKLLWFVTSTEERSRWRVEEFCSKRSNTSGRPPTLSGFLNGNEDHWIHHQGPMDGGEEKRVLGAVVAGLVGKVLDRHPVTCSGETFVQNTGGAIGLDLTCTVAKSVMQKFDSKLESFLQGLAYNCHLNSTYVDDKLIVTQVPPPGLRYVGGNAVVVESQVEPDRLIPGDRRTAVFIQSVANDIFGCLSFTYDCPSNNEDQRMPVLDLKVWMDRCEDGTNRIRHDFYDKPCA